MIVQTVLRLHRPSLSCSEYRSWREATPFSERDDRPSCMGRALCFRSEGDDDGEAMPMNMHHEIQDPRLHRSVMYVTS